MVVLQCLLVAVLLAGSQAKSVRQSGCPFFCPFIHLPVCGSNAVTYGNQCELDIAACQLAAQFSNEPDFEPLTTAYQGHCGRDDAKRQLDLWNHPSGCPMICPAIYAPVCGSNGQTYSSNCSLESAACFATFNNPDAEPITVAHSGGCNGEGLFPLLVS
ncbi:thrombin inhibitor rhodniin-like [Branchiostoma lanceolatum]|uniref:thrombin inhibitor rhodniin-like n=1 Tax=Branchiostoma lanceolatum TaxID=7740 RepID=UPI003456F558